MIRNVYSDECNPMRGGVCAATLVDQVFPVALWNVGRDSELDKIACVRLSDRRNAYSVTSGNNY